MKRQVMRNTFFDFPKDAISDSITQDTIFISFFMKSIIKVSFLFAMCITKYFCKRQVGGYPIIFASNVFSQLSFDSEVYTKSATAADFV